MKQFIEHEYTREVVLHRKLAAFGTAAMRYFEKQITVHGGDLEITNVDDYPRAIVVQEHGEYPSAMVLDINSGWSYLR